MQVRCPECHTPFDAPDAGGELTCPACMAAFTIAPAARPGEWMEVELRTPAGRLLGPWDRHLVREKIYLGEIKGQEQVRPPNGVWVDIASRPEFAEVLHLVGVDLGQRRTKSNLRGWRKTGSAITGGARPLTADEATRAMRELKTPEEPGKKPLPVVPIAVAVLVVVGIAVAALLF